MHDMLILYVQALVGFAVLFALAASALTQSSDYSPPSSLLQTILLMTFVRRHVPRLDHGWFYDEPQADTASLSRRTQRLLVCYRKFRDEGTIPEDDLLPWHLRHEPISHVVGAAVIGGAAFVFAPIFGLLAFRLGEREAGLSTTPIIAPAERAYRLVQIVGLLSAVVFWSGCVMYTTDGELRIVLLVILGFPLLSLLTAIVRVIAAQRRWKSFWLAQLSLVVQSAAAADNHDLYMRSSYLQDTVKREPVIPLTEVQRAVLVVTALVQLALVKIVPLVQALWRHSG